MMECIKQVTIFMIFQGLLLRLVSDDEYKKIIKICCGMILVLIILRPFGNVINCGENAIRDFPDIVKEFFDEINAKELNRELAEVYGESNDMNREMVLREYQNELKKQIGSIMNKYGLTVDNVVVIIDEARENYVGRLIIYYSGRFENNGTSSPANENNIKPVDDIEKIRIVIGEDTGQNSVKKESDSPDIMAVKNEIVDMYGIDYELIEFSLKY